MAVAYESVDENLGSSDDPIARQRLVLLLGSARSGTTWLGNILNSSPRSLYSHEPLLRFPSERLEPLLIKIRESGRLSPEERQFMLGQWSRAYFAMRRPPFFEKDHSRWPPEIMWGAWLAVRAANHGHRLFQWLFSPASGSEYDLVVKQGGLDAWAQQYVQALSPEALIVLVRHPCAVIASVRRGERLNLMDKQNRTEWMNECLPHCNGVNYTTAQIEAMSDVEFSALCWLVENNLYVKLADEHPDAQIVDYAHLYKNPLSVTKNLFDALGWEVTEHTRRFLHDTTLGLARRLKSLVSASHPYFSVYRSGVDSLSGWKAELSASDQAQILAMAHPLVRRFWPDQSTEVGNYEAH